MSPETDLAAPLVAADPAAPGSVSLSPETDLAAQLAPLAAADPAALGAVYEHLLGHTAARADGPTLALRGVRNGRAAVSLAALERLRDDPPAALRLLRDATGRDLPALRRALAGADPHACSGDRELQARLGPWAPLLRRDPAGDLLVFETGRLHVVAGPGRRVTGAHYTPAALAGPLVRAVLDALAHRGPAEGLPPARWRLRTADELLALRICDPAMGTGAFLRVACHELAALVCAAWARDPAGAPADPAARERHARRLVAARCLFGVDRDPLAVEVARHALALELDAPELDAPLRRHLRVGDALLGLADLADLDPDLRAALRPDELARAADALTAISLLPARPAPARTALAARVLAHPARDARRAALAEGLRAALADPRARADLPEALAELAALPGPGPDGAPRAPLHWPLAFPDVFARGGFDAFVGNPPFLGGQRISGALGVDYRDHLVERVAGGRRGSADLCAYFFLRAAELTCPGGHLAFVATNTIAQGDTREVGLDQLVARGLQIVGAAASEPWPGDASLAVARVHLVRGTWRGERVLDGAAVPEISPALVRPGAVAGRPRRLSASAGRSFIGSYVLGLGFVLGDAEARALIADDPRNACVVRPYLGGDDLVHTVDQAPTRHVICFQDWPLDRASAPAGHTGPVAADFPACLELVRARVKPERDRLARGDATARDRARRWWQFARPTAALYAALADLPSFFACARVSKYVLFSRVCGPLVPSEQVVVVASAAPATLAVLQSSLHALWALEHASTLETRARYTPSDCLETFPFPEGLAGLADVGDRHDAQRRAVMRAARLGLTKAYNRFHDPTDADPGVRALRDRLVELDLAVAGAYGWGDLDLGHGFHDTRAGRRFTVSEAARRTVLDRLLAENLARAAGGRAPMRARDRRRAGVENG